MKPGNDPFEHFGEQEASWSAISEHRDRMVALARQAFAARPEEPIGGLILCPGTSLGRVLAQIAPPEQHPDPERQTCVTAMPRPDFDVFLRLHAPEVAGAVPEPDPEWRRQGRTLPILVATAHGHRLACVPYDIE